MAKARFVLRMRYHVGRTVMCREVARSDGRAPEAFLDGRTSYSLLNENAVYAVHAHKSPTTRNRSCLYASIPKLPTSRLKRPRAQSTFTNGLATAGRTLFPTPRTSRPCADRKSV